VTLWRGCISAARRESNPDSFFFWFVRFGHGHFDRWDNKSVRNCAICHPSIDAPTIKKPAGLANCQAAPECSPPQKVWAPTKRRPPILGGTRFVVSQTSKRISFWTDCPELTLHEHWLALSLRQKIVAPGTLNLTHDELADRGWTRKQNPRVHVGRVCFGPGDKRLIDQ
jgi:hypothetical protein